MKSLRNILTTILMITVISVFAKNVTQKITVKGQCGDCKERIETALDIKGVSYAEWDVESKTLTVRYNDKKITENKIHSIISELGYATDKVAADKTAESKLPNCCKPKTTKKACCTNKDSCNK